MTEREDLVDAMAKLVFEAVNPTCSWSLYKGSRTKGEFCKGMSAALDEAVKRLEISPSDSDMLTAYGRGSRESFACGWRACVAWYKAQLSRYGAVEDPAVRAVREYLNNWKSTEGPGIGDVFGDWAAQIVAIVDRARGRE